MSSSAPAPVASSAPASSEVKSSPAAADPSVSSSPAVPAAAAAPVERWIVLTDSESSLLQVADQQFAQLGIKYEDFFSVLDFFKECAKNSKFVHDVERVKFIQRLMILFFKNKYGSSDKMPENFAALMPALPALLDYIGQSVASASKAAEPHAKSCFPW